MQSLTLVQGDAVLDLMEQCWAVVTIHEQKQTHDQRSRWRTKVYGEADKMGKELADSFQKAIGLLVYYHRIASDLKIDDGILSGILLKHLPRSLTVDLDKST